MIPLTKAQKKEVASLADAKGRRRTGAFMAEGTKCVLDTIETFTLRHIFATPKWLAEHPLPAKAARVAVEVNRAEIGEMTSLTLAPDVIAVYEQPVARIFSPDDIHDDIILALDRVQDPGNLGTIMRTADWMGITTILAATGTADCFSPKVVQSTMGAISRVRVLYGDLPDMLRLLSRRMPVYGTFLGGENIYTAPLAEPSAVIVMGNEGQGISPEVEALVNHRLLIPSWPPGRPTSESLNVATATAIVLSQFRSRKY